eukprot:45157-Amphidinium_carterae.1
MDPRVETDAEMDVPHIPVGVVVDDQPGENIGMVVSEPDPEEPRHISTEEVECRGSDFANEE